MNEIRIRDREPADVPRCLSVLADVHRVDHYPLNWPADPHRWLSPPDALHAWVAESASGVAGHVAVHRAGSAADHTATATVEVGRLFVAPTARRLGVAIRLLDQARRWATEHRVDLALEIVDTPRSAAAMALYESTGWRYTRTATATWTTPDGDPVRLRHYSLTCT